MSLRKNILASWIAHAVMIAIGVFMLPFVRNTLTPGAYGAWLFINMISGYAGLLYMGFGATICRYVSKHVAAEEWTELNSVTSTIFAVYSCMAGVVLLLAMGFSAIAPLMHRWGNLPMYEVQAVILINGVSTAIGMVGSVFGGILIGTQRVGLKRSIEVGCGVLRFLLAISCLRLRPELTTLSVMFCGVTILENILLVVFAKRSVPQLAIHFRLISRQTLRECFGFSGYSVVGQIAEQVIYLTDTTVIGFVLGIASVDVYYIGLRVCQMIQEPLAKIGEVVLPKAGQLHTQSRHTELVQVVERMTALTFILICGFFIGSAYFGEMLIRIWIGSGLEQSHRVLMILLAAQLVAQPMLILRKTMLGMGIVRIPSLIDLFEAFLNLVLSLVLIFRWGIEGVAWGTFIPLVFVELFIFLPYACREIGVRRWHLFQHSILPCLIPLTSLWVYCEWVSRQGYPDRWITLLAIAGGGGTVLAATGYPIAWAMQRQEKLATSPLTTASTSST